MHRELIAVLGGASAESDDFGDALRAIRKEALFLDELGDEPRVAALAFRSARGVFAKLGLDLEKLVEIAVGCLQQVIKLRRTARDQLGADRYGLRPQGGSRKSAIGSYASVRSWPDRKARLSCFQTNGSVSASSRSTIR